MLAIANILGLRANVKLSIERRSVCDPSQKMIRLKQDVSSLSFFRGYVAPRST